MHVVELEYGSLKELHYGIKHLHLLVCNESDRAMICKTFRPAHSRARSIGFFYRTSVAAAGNPVASSEDFHFLQCKSDSFNRNTSNCSVPAPCVPWPNMGPSRTTPASAQVFQRSMSMIQIDTALIQHSTKILLHFPTPRVRMPQLQPDFNFVLVEFPKFHFPNNNNSNNV